jgi:uncharacterized protein involved in exopolysaccharide biosynthesis
LNFTQLLLILSARRALIALTLLTTVATAVVFTMMLPPQYTASTSVLVHFKDVDPISGAVLPAQSVPSYMATQADIIRSHAVALRVVETLKLATDAVARQKFLDSADGKGTVENWLASSLLKRLGVRLSRDSRLIQISFTDSYPEFAAAAARSQRSGSISS